MNAARLNCGNRFTHIGVNDQITVNYGAIEIKGN
jgi:hypothetical protein